MSLNKVDYRISTNEEWRDGLALQSGDPPSAVDLEGSSFVAQLRQPAESLHVVLECSTTNSRIEIVEPPSDGVIAWNVSVAVLRTIPVGVYEYDMVWTNVDGVVDRFTVGTVTVERGVTRT